MKNLIKSITLMALVITAFSCSDEADKNISTPTIAEVAEFSSNLKSFNKALEVTGLKSTFEAAGNYTVFVPTDAAFAGVLGGLTVEEFNTANPGLLETVLKYHVIANAKVLSSDLTNNQSVATLQGQNITITLTPNAYFPEIDPDLFDYEENSIFVNSSSRVFARDVNCTNGVIHIIDSVLLPGS